MASAFQTCITLSTKNFCLMLAVHLGLNSLYGRWETLAADDVVCTAVILHCFTASEQQFHLL